MTLPSSLLPRGLAICHGAATGLIGLLALSIAPTPALAQPVPPPSARAASAASVPTTRILAIGTLTPNADAASLKGTLPAEVRDTVRIYLDGKLDQWFVKQDNTGVVFILNVTDLTQARAMLEALPLGKAGLMTFDLIPLGPLRPLGVLLGN